MNEETRQKWIGIAMDLMVAYYQTQGAVHEEDRFTVHPDEFVRPMCDRVADAVGDDATGEFVWEILQKRLC